MDHGACVFCRDNSTLAGSCSDGDEGSSSPALHCGATSSFSSSSDISLEGEAIDKVAGGGHGGGTDREEGEVELADEVRTGEGGVGEKTRRNVWVWWRRRWATITPLNSVIGDHRALRWRMHGIMPLEEQRRWIALGVFHWSLGRLEAIHRTRQWRASQQDIGRGRVSWSSKAVQAQASTSNNARHNEQMHTSWL